jgi:peptide/nickel transport system permease protein
MASPVGELNEEVSSLDTSEVPAKAIEGRTPGQLAWARMKRDKVTMIALVVVVLVVLLAIAAPIFRMFGWFDPYAFHLNLVPNFGSMPKGFGGGISWAHPFGVEPQTGRDVLSRCLLGIAYSMMIATAAVLVSAFFGVTIGIISGYMGGATDFWLGRFMDLILSFPQLLMLLALSSVLKQRIASMLHTQAGSASASAIYLIVVLGFFGWPYLARIVRGQVLTMRSREFVEAAESLGATRRRIWFRELLPNLWAPIIVYVSLTLPLNIGAEAALSFLGVGLQPPTPSLGNILNDSSAFYVSDPGYFIIPGAVLLFVVLGFNMLGDGLRDALDPKSGR